MKIYLASSWRNKDRVRTVGTVLRQNGHECFDFTNPGDHTALPNGFHWSEIDPDWQEWTANQYRDHLLNHDLSKVGLAQDLGGMEWADVCVALMPFGRSASLELGWFIGKGKPAHILLGDDQEPELMFGLATKIHTNMIELCSTLAEPVAA